MKERLKQLLQEIGMTQAEFADHIGVGRPSITHIMTGRDKTSQTVVSKTLLKFPELNPMWLLKGEGEMYRSHAEPVRKVVPAVRDTAAEEVQTALFPADEAEPAALPISTVQETPVVSSITAREVFQPVPTPMTAAPTFSQPEKQPEKTVEAIPEQQPEKAVEAKPVKPQRKLRKIVFFYDDRSFEEYLPDES